MNIARSAFGTGTNPDVGNDSHPWASINGWLSPTNDYDYFKVELQAGETIIADIDYAKNHGASVDTYIRGIYSPGRSRLTSNDDTNPSVGGGGSVHSYDSYASTTASQSGT